MQTTLEQPQNENAIAQPKSPKLTRFSPSKKRELFIKKYVETLNATESAKYAGFSARTAYSAGSRLLKEVEVRKAIENAQKERFACIDSKEEYKKKTLEHFEKISRPENSVKARYWEMIGNVNGFFEKNQGNQTNIAIFQIIKREVGAFANNGLLSGSNSVSVVDTNAEKVIDVEAESAEEKPISNSIPENKYSDSESAEKGTTSGSNVAA